MPISWDERRALRIGLVVSPELFFAAVTVAAFAAYKLIRALAAKNS